MRKGVNKEHLPYSLRPSKLIKNLQLTQSLGVISVKERTVVIEQIEPKILFIFLLF